MTDAGEAYIKALGNRQGPHALAADLVGTDLAHWFGLQTFDTAVFRLDPDDDVPLHGNRKAEPGPVFATRAERGGPWSGAPDELALIDNVADIGRLVVFDTWVRNCDRYPPDPATRKANYDNVFLSEEAAPPGRFRLVAMDHGHAFTCGGDLNGQIATIDRIQDHTQYGYFPAFRPFVRVEVVRESVARLATFPRDVAETSIGRIPAEWDVSQAGRKALLALIVDRAEYLSRDVEATVARLVA